MTSRIRKKQKLQRKNQYINKSYNDFRNELFDHATTYFSNQNRDFSPSSLGGMFLDFAAIVGDSLSFYVEQQFNELNPETATSTENIIKHLRNAGINSSNNSPASLYVTFLIEVDVISSTNPEPKSEFLPIIKEGSRLISDSGIEFTLVEDIDFDTAETFEMKVKTVKESYFKNETNETVDEVDSLLGDGAVESDVSDAMARYGQAITNFNN